MAIPESLREYLQRAGVSYETLAHPKAYTAAEAAKGLGVSPDLLAKTIVVDLGGRVVLAALPASCRADLSALGAALGEGPAALAEESTFRRLFPDCEIGTMPPLGGAYGMDVIVEERTAAEETITFQAGSHRDAIRMGWDEFARLEDPGIAAFAASLE